MTRRRSGNPGRQEREAGKRHRRARVWNSGMGAEVEPLKLGRKHLSRYYRRSYVLAVAEREKLAIGAQEIDLQHQKQE
jgi:hypothetical protein